MSCGKTIGHGETCQEGWLCDACERIEKLEKLLDEVRAVAFDNSIDEIDRDCRISELLEARAKDE